MPSSSRSVSAKPSAVSPSSTGDGDAALGGFLFQQALEGLVAVAQDFDADLEALGIVRHLVGEQALMAADALGDVDAQAGELLAAREVADAVAVGELFVAVDLEPVGADARDRAAGRAGEAGRVEGADVGLAAVDEVVGGAAVEGLFRGRSEGVAAMAGRGARILGRVLDDAVEQLPVMRGDVLDVAQVLVAALDLEERMPASASARRLALWSLSFIDSTCLSWATMRPCASSSV
jgi:hypothetical protein